MESKSLQDLVHFSPDGPATYEVFETPRLWSQLICLDRSHRVGPITDPGADGLFVVVAGEVVIQVDRSRQRVKQWATVLAPAGAEVSVANASMDPAVLLVVTAPPPLAGGGDGSEAA